MGLVPHSPTLAYSNLTIFSSSYTVPTIAIAPLQCPRLILTSLSPFVLFFLANASSKRLTFLIATKKRRTFNTFFCERKCLTPENSTTHNKLNNPKQPHFSSPPFSREFQSFFYHFSGIATCSPLFSIFFYYYFYFSLFRKKKKKNNVTQ